MSIRQGTPTARGQSKMTSRKAFRGSGYLAARGWGFPVAITLLFCSAGCAGSAETRARNVITAFKQGSELNGAGNCVSIATIKAAAHHFGGGCIFASRVENEDGSIAVTMHDGTAFRLERDFVSFVDENAYFGRGTDETLHRQAIEAYAAMALRLKQDFLSRDFQSEFHDEQLKQLRDKNAPTPEEAVQLLNGGIDVQRGPELLGIASYQRSHQGNAFIRFFTVRWFLGNRPTCVANSSGHAWFVSRRVGDRDGEAVDMYVPWRWFGRAGGGRTSGGYCLEGATPAQEGHCQ